MKRICIRAVVVLAVALGTGPAIGAEWFTVTGDLHDSGTDTVQIDLSDLSKLNTDRVIRLRVNLAQPRKLGPSEQFTSYESNVFVECSTGSVFHIDQKRYEQALWRGKSTSQIFEDSRPMAFGGLDPNPKSRILKGACSPSASSMN